MPIELVPRAFDRMRKAFTPGEAKKAINKLIKDHREDFRSTKKKSHIDDRAYMYSPEWLTSKTRRFNMFNGFQQMQERR